MAKVTVPKTPAVQVTKDAVKRKAWVPNLSAANEVVYPKLGSRPPYLLMVHPERWVIMHGKVVPGCGNLVLRGGINGVVKVTLVNPATGVSETSFRARSAIAAMEEKGWKVIPADIDGPGESYLWCPPVAGEEPAYLSRWETPHAGSEQVTVDEVGYATWLRGLIEKGDIARPPAYVLERMRAGLTKEAADALDKLAAFPALRPVYERLLFDIAAIDAELAEVGGSAIERGSPASLSGILDGEGGE